MKQDLKRKMKTIGKAKRRLAPLLAAVLLACALWGAAPWAMASRADETSNQTFLLGSWVKDDKGWRFSQSYGSIKYPASTWGKYQGHWYYFGQDGYMATKWKEISGSWYYFSPEPGKGEGVMTTGWLYDGSYPGWFYFNQLGIMVTGWHKIQGYWYYFNPKSDGSQGLMAANQMVDGIYVNQNGQMNELQ